MASRGPAGHNLFLRLFNCAWCTPHRISLFPWNVTRLHGAITQKITTAVKTWNEDEFTETCFLQNPNNYTVLPYLQGEVKQLMESGRHLQSIILIQVTNNWRYNRLVLTAGNTDMEFKTYAVDRALSSQWALVGERNRPIRVSHGG